MKSSTPWRLPASTTRRSATLPIVPAMNSSSSRGVRTDAYGDLAGGRDLVGIVRVMNPLRLVRAAAVARIGVGTALALRAGPLLRASVRDEKPSGFFILFARTGGMRDALIRLRR